ncbi:DUF1343 domain-containing protein [Muriicola sp. Z0-33]|uniref:exo-beta-N-acetylmuramidase NamZ family protein n=1 Tax=Muriicola sp. Z0-33 TaxID=2816957 RepID=UPI002238BD20|nr:DUF1343 domain-containing protein [Muriicola sp. Z0-33]MCW5516851.1 DUF1343 domain-containing protein [Muriicola sp. Z0-33]
MAFLSGIKNTVLLWLLILSACGNQEKNSAHFTRSNEVTSVNQQDGAIVVGANRLSEYLPMLKDKTVGIVANQTSVIFKTSEENTYGYTHLVDSLRSLKVDIKKVFAPEHGFRGKADAGEHVKDGTDTKTGLPIISLYGKNRKPSQEQLDGLDLVIFDIQDVGVRFYTYIATLQLVMEACAEKGIGLVVLDRPNPNGHYIDGPTMEEAHTGFLGMTPIPLVYGMTIGEYANMINEEGWLENERKVALNIISLQNYTHQSAYSLPIRPSPNLPNDTAITLYPGLGLFEGTNVNAGRGTEYQFQRYGAPFLDTLKYDFQYTPVPNFGSKNPKHKREVCYGTDLSKSGRMHQVALKHILDAYQNCNDKTKFFNTSGFTKHAGTASLQEQIEAGFSEDEIRKSWEADLDRFKKIREPYLIYK